MSRDLTTQDASTQDSLDDGSESGFPKIALTILHHPDGSRVGDGVVLDDIAHGLPAEISRVHPKFTAADSASGLPLFHARVSREPVWLKHQSDGLVFTPGGDKVRAAVDGETLQDPVLVPRRRLVDKGALLELGKSVLLWIHSASPKPRSISEHGLVGVHPRMRAVKDAAARIAPLAVPVLICGESGVGKELVARAIHRLGPRADGPLVTVNMSAIPISMAAAELFGHARGAFTGAEQARKGCFERADGGTLFLDEIGETPGDIQPQLLRALESGEIQPVGDTSRKVSIRLIAATDADLQRLVDEGKFRRSLLHRLQTALLVVPPLRQRVVDIPLLLHHFLRDQLEEFDAVHLLTGSSRQRTAWLGLDVITALMDYAFPGNVRELRNIASQIAIHFHDRPRAKLPPGFVASGASSAASPVAASATASPAGGSESEPAGEPVPAVESLTDDLVREALQSNRWNVSRTAQALGVAKNTVMARIRQIPGLRLASEIPESELRAVFERHGGDVDAMIDELQVSAHGLRLRLRELGLR